MAVNFVSEYKSVYGQFPALIFCLTEGDEVYQAEIMLIDYLKTSNIKGLTGLQYNK